MGRFPRGVRALGVGSLAALAVAGPACGDAPSDLAEAGAEATTGPADSADGTSDDGEGDAETGAGCGPAGAAVEHVELVLAPEPSSWTLPACGGLRAFVPAAEGAAVALELVVDGPALAWLAWPDDPDGTLDPRVGPLPLAPGATALEQVWPRSGELVIAVQAGPEPVELALSARCVAACRETTRFPIALVHGFSGFQAIGPVDYFFGVPASLSALGYPVFTPALDPYNAVPVRAAQLAERVDALLADQRARKVNLVGHSQGGLDSRWLVGTLGYGDRVASLVTFATPHRGTPVADVALGLLPGDSGLALYVLMELLGAQAGEESDAKASIHTLTEAWVQGTLNPQNPDDPRVRYVSWSGQTCLSLLTCGDAVEPLLSGTYSLLLALRGANDGLVAVSSAQWGEDRGAVWADHFDQIGQIAGLTGPNFDHVAFYVALARDLAAAGH